MRAERERGRERGRQGAREREGGSEGARMRGRKSICTIQHGIISQHPTGGRKERGREGREGGREEGPQEQLSTRCFWDRMPRKQQGTADSIRQHTSTIAAAELQSVNRALIKRA